MKLIRDYGGFRYKDIYKSSMMMYQKKGNSFKKMKKNVYFLVFCSFYS